MFVKTDNFDSKEFMLSALVKRVKPLNISGHHIIQMQSAMKQKFFLHFSTNIASQTSVKGTLM